MRGKKSGWRRVPAWGGESLRSRKGEGADVKQDYKFKETQRAPSYVVKKKSPLNEGKRSALIVWRAFPRTFIQRATRPEGKG